MNDMSSYDLLIIGNKEDDMESHDLLIIGK